MSIEAQKLDEILRELRNQSRLANRSSSSGNSGGSSGAGLGSSGSNILSSAASGLESSLEKLHAGTLDVNAVFGLVAGTVGIFNTKLGDMVSGMASAFMQVNNAMKEAGQYGVTLGQDLFRFNKEVKNAYLTLEDFRYILADHAKQLAGLGSDMDKSASAFLKTTASLQTSEVGIGLKQFGLEAQELADITAASVSWRKSLLAEDKDSVENAAKAAGKLALEMTAMANITGQTRKEQQRALEEQMTDVRMQAAIQLKGSKFGEDFSSAIAGMSKPVQQLMTELATGGIRTQRGMEQAAAMGSATNDLRTLVQAIERGNESEIKAAKEKANAAVVERTSSTQFLNVVKTAGTDMGNVTTAFAQLFQENLAMQKAIQSKQEEAKKEGRTLSAEDAWKEIDAESKKKILEGGPDSNLARSLNGASDMMKGASSKFADAVNYLGQHINKLVPDLDTFFKGLPNKLNESFEKVSEALKSVIEGKTSTTTTTPTKSKADGTDFSSFLRGSANFSNMFEFKQPTTVVVGDASYPEAVVRQDQVEKAFSDVYEFGQRSITNSQANTKSATSVDLSKVIPSSNINTEPTNTSGIDTVVKTISDHLVNIKDALSVSYKERKPEINISSTGFNEKSAGNIQTSLDNITGFVSRPDDTKSPVIDMKPISDQLTLAIKGTSTEFKEEISNLHKSVNKSDTKELPNQFKTEILNLHKSFDKIISPAPLSTTSGLDKKPDNITTDQPKQSITNKPDDRISASAVNISKSIGTASTEIRTTLNQLPVLSAKIIKIDDAVIDKLKTVLATTQPAKTDAKAADTTKTTKTTDTKSTTAVTTKPTTATTQPAKTTDTKSTTAVTTKPTTATTQPAKTTDTKSTTAATTKPTTAATTKPTTATTQPAKTTDTKSTTTKPTTATIKTSELPPIELIGRSETAKVTDKNSNIPSFPGFNIGNNNSNDFFSSINSFKSEIGKQPTQIIEQTKTMFESAFQNVMSTNPSMFTPPPVPSIATGGDSMIKAMMGKLEQLPNIMSAVASNTGIANDNARSLKSSITGAVTGNRWN